MNKTYTLNEYYPYANSTATRAEIYSGNIAAAHLLAYHKNKKAKEISISECVDACASNLTMPDTVMNMLDDKIKAATNERTIITGVDSYLSILSKQAKNAFMVALYNRIDAGKLNAVYMISKTYFEGTKFSNPKFENSLSVVYIGEDVESCTPPTFTVISGRWVRSQNNPTNWSELLEHLGQYEPTGNYTLVLNNFTNTQAGLSDNVTQLFDANAVALKYYEIDVDLSTNVLEALMEKCKVDSCQPLEYLKKRFGESNVSVLRAIKRLLVLRDDEFWSAYIWLLQKAIDGNSYLSRVLATNVDTENLLRKYVSEMAISLLDIPEASCYAAERAECIKGVGTLADGLIIEFIGLIRNSGNEKVACWLNCGTLAEHIEIIRRVSESDLTIGLPSLWTGLYPLFEDYLSDSYDYENEDITTYFREYRRFKASNKVTESFVRCAFDAILPASISFRDTVLQEFPNRTDTALLVVDGMGAEYYPLLLSMAKRRAMNIASAEIAKVRLPSSTEFNELSWDERQTLQPSIQEVDNISHVGAEKNVKCSFEHNLAATFDVFEAIFNRIANALTNYERVIITADHGSSRLAVIAHENKLSKTLPWAGDPLDWRFSIAPLNKACPSEFESYYDTEKNVTYWIVRGYNRLPKQGGKLSVHGGATLEERLVPVIVFSKTKANIEPELIKTHKTEQLIEKDFDFGI